MTDSDEIRRLALGLWKYFSALAAENVKKWNWVEGDLDRILTLLDAAPAPVFPAPSGKPVRVGRTTPDPATKVTVTPDPAYAALEAVHDRIVLGDGYPVEDTLRGVREITRRALAARGGRG